MARPLMKLATRARAALVAASIGAARIAHAHHDGDPSEELPLWLMVAVAALVALVWLAVWRIRHQRRRR
jgi:hypothetical protein